jgi:hypothetical protein
MLVHVIPMHMVEMAIVKIIHVAPVANGDVSTIRAMLMGVVGVVFLGTCVHCRRSLLGCAIWHPVIPPLEEIGSQPVQRGKIASLSFDVVLTSSPIPGGLSNLR